MDNGNGKEYFVYIWYNFIYDWLGLIPPFRYKKIAGNDENFLSNICRPMESERLKIIMDTFKRWKMISIQQLSLNLTQPLKPTWAWAPVFWVCWVVDHFGFRVNKLLMLPIHFVKLSINFKLEDDLYFFVMEDNLKF